MREGGSHGGGERGSGRGEGARAVPLTNSRAPFRPTSATRCLAMNVDWGRQPQTIGRVPLVSQTSPVRCHVPWVYPQFRV